VKIMPNEKKLFINGVEKTSTTKVTLDRSVGKVIDEALKKNETELSESSKTEQK